MPRGDVRLRVGWLLLRDLGHTPAPAGLLGSVGVLPAGQTLLLAAEGRPSPGSLCSLAGLETGAGLTQRRTKPDRSLILWPGALGITASKKVWKTPSETLSLQIPVLVDQLDHLLFECNCIC